MTDERLEEALEDWAATRTANPLGDDEADAVVAAAHRRRAEANRLRALGVFLAAAVVLLTVGAAVGSTALLLYLGQDASEPEQIVAVSPEQMPTMAVLVSEGSVHTDGLLEVLGEGALVGEVGRDRVALDADSQAQLGGSSDDLAIHLNRGTVAVQAASRSEGGSLSVRVGEISVDVVGTRFSVSRLEAGIRVDVGEGLVSVARADQTWQVEAGQSLVVSEVEEYGTADAARVDQLLRLVPEPPEEVEPKTPAPAKETWDAKAIRLRVIEGDPDVTAVLEARVESVPTDHESLALLGGIREKARDLDGAALAFGRAAEHAPPAEAARHRFRQGELLLDLDRASEAVEVFQAALDGEAGALRPEVMLGLAQAQLASGADGRATLEELIEAYPASAAALRAADLLE